MNSADFAFYLPQTYSNMIFFVNPNRFCCFTWSHPAKMYPLYLTFPFAVPTATTDTIHFWRLNWWLRMNLKWAKNGAKIVWWNPVNLQWIFIMRAVGITSVSIIKADDIDIVPRKSIKNGCRWTRFLTALYLWVILYDTLRKRALQSKIKQTSTRKKVKTSCPHSDAVPTTRVPHLTFTFVEIREGFLNLIICTFTLGNSLI